ncbi:MAG: hypothetical protein ACL7BU_09400 [Candidatus Phlomobacter fragariae]
MLGGWSGLFRDNTAKFSIHEIKTGEGIVSVQFDVINSSGYIFCTSSKSDVGIRIPL